MATQFDSLKDWPVAHVADVLRSTIQSEAGHIAYVNDEIDALIEAAKREGAASVNAWQPIESCPRDSTEVLLTDGVRVCAGLYSQYLNEWLGVYAPTHWMPLPAAPRDEPRRP